MPLLVYVGAVTLVLAAGAALLFTIQSASYWWPKVKRRLARRQIGSWTDLAACRASVREAAIRWLADPPRVRTGDDLKVLFLNSLGPAPRTTSWWPEALLAKGVIIDYAESHDPRAIPQLLQFAERYVRADGILREPPPELDYCAIGEVFVFLHQHTGLEKYRTAADQIATYLIGRFEREGVLAYGTTQPGRERLVDTTGLICPFLASYGRTYQSRKASQAAMRQLGDFLANGMESRSGLPYHGYTGREPHPPVGIAGWGRGTGWLAVGLADTLASMPQDDPDRASLVQACAALARSVSMYERPAGGWGTMLTAASAPYDSSATAMIGYFLSRIRLAGVPTPPGAETRAARALMGTVRRNGVVDWAEGAIMDVGRHSMEFGPAPYAQGMALALLALSEAGGAGSGNPGRQARRTGE